MKQLTMKDLANVVRDLINKGIDLEKVQVYIGNDDELNGIHTAWYIQQVNSDDVEDEYIVEMINEDGHNISLENKGILIS